MGLLDGLFTNANTSGGNALGAPVTVASDGLFNEPSTKDASVVLATVPATRTITGRRRFTAMQAEQAVQNLGPGDLILRHNDGTVAASDRIVSPTGADYVLRAGKAVTLIDDVAASRTRIALSDADRAASADAADRAVTVAGVSGLSAIRALRPAAAGLLATLLPGVATPGAATYEWKPSSTQADDGQYVLGDGVSPSGRWEMRNVAGRRINLWDYGARPDGTTDLTPAITAAVTQWQTTCNLRDTCTLYLPGAKRAYRMATPYQPPGGYVYQRITIEGDADPWQPLREDPTSIQWVDPFQGGSATVIQVDPGISGFLLHGTARFIGLRNLALVGQGTSGGRAASSGITMYSQETSRFPSTAYPGENRFSLENVFFGGFGGRAIDADSCVSNFMRNVTIQGCAVGFSAGRQATPAAGSAESSGCWDLSIEGLTIQGCGQALELGGVMALRVKNFLCQGNTLAVKYLPQWSIKSLLVDGAWFESNATLSDIATDPSQAGFQVWRSIRMSTPGTWTIAGNGWHLYDWDAGGVDLTIQAGAADCLLHGCGFNSIVASAATNAQWRDTRRDQYQLQGGASGTWTHDTTTLARHVHFGVVGALTVVLPPATKWADGEEITYSFTIEVGGSPAVTFANAARVGSWSSAGAASGSIGSITFRKVSGVWIPKAILPFTST